MWMKGKVKGRTVLRMLCISSPLDSLHIIMKGNWWIPVHSWKDNLLGRILSAVIYIGGHRLRNRMPETCSLSTNTSSMYKDLNFFLLLRLLCHNLWYNARLRWYVRVQNHVPVLGLDNLKDMHQNVHTNFQYNTLICQRYYDHCGS